MPENVETRQSPEERAIKVLVRCGKCRRPLGKVYVPYSTAKLGDGKVSLGGMGMFAKKQTVKGSDDGTVHYACPDPGCQTRYAASALDVAKWAIEAAASHHGGFQLPSSSRAR
jgi:hypothetical protein